MQGSMTVLLGQEIVMVQRRARLIRWWLYEKWLLWQDHRTEDSYRKGMQMMQDAQSKRSDLGLISATQLVGFPEDRYQRGPR